MPSRFAIVESGSPIEVLEMGKRFKEDVNQEKKVNLSVGGFADDGGPGGHDFKVVKRIELELAHDENLSHGYLPALVRFMSHFNIQVFALLKRSNSTLVACF